MSVGVGGMAGGAGMTVGAPHNEIDDLANRINSYRRSKGCPNSLKWDDRLTWIAEHHSEDMAKRKYFDHVDPDGHDPFDRLRATKITYRAAAENIAEGQSTGRAVFEDWIASEGHRKNIENCDYEALGIGMYEGRWTLVLVQYKY